MRLLELINNDYAIANLRAYLRIFRHIANEGLGVRILEFGVASGGTASLLLNAASCSKVMVESYWGFDSFAGLPQSNNPDESKRWKPGNWKYDYKKALSNIQFLNSKVAIKLIKTAFCDIIPITAEDTTMVNLIHIDCDMYESTIQALNACIKLLENPSIIVFDDYYSGLLTTIDGEKAAWEHYTMINLIEALPWFSYNANGAVFFTNRVHRDV